jgi:hypothetical protein
MLKFVELDKFFEVHTEVIAFADGKLLMKDKWPLHMKA